MSSESAKNHKGRRSTQIIPSFSASDGRITVKQLSNQPNQRFTHNLPVFLRGRKTKTILQILRIYRLTTLQTGGDIWIDKDSWDQMDETNQAALITHEALYAFLREQGHGDVSSLRTRRAIGYVFAGNSFTLPTVNLSPTPYLECGTGDVPPLERLEIYLDSSKSLVFAQYVFNEGILMGTNQYFYLTPVPNYPHGEDLYNALVSNTCPSDHDFGVLNFAGPAPTGPVEFDRVTQYSLYCLRGQAPVLETWELPPGFQQGVQAQFKCQLSNSNQNPLQAP